MAGKPSSRRPKAKTPPKTPVPLRPGPNGGMLRVGGTNKGGTGRPPNLLRQQMAEALQNAKAGEVVQNIISGDIYEELGHDRQGRPIIGTTRNNDRLKAVELAAELAGEKQPFPVTVNLLVVVDV